MKIWHDDIRPAPEGWVWARTNNEALKLLRENDVEEISLDHDLGLDHIETEEAHLYINYKGQAEETGLDLVDHMCAEGLCPDKITVHSWNPSGAQRMVKTLKAKGFHAKYIPYEAQV